MTTDSYVHVSKLRALVADWESLKADLSTKAEHDRKEGFEFTAKAEECAMDALSACVAGVRDLLPKEGE